MAHTSGPWREEEDYIWGPNMEMIAEVRGFGANLPMKDNGRLLAAAPELLCALNATLVALSVGEHVDQQAAIDYGMDVIAKINGHEPIARSGPGAASR